MQRRVILAAALAVCVLSQLAGCAFVYPRVSLSSSITSPMVFNFTPACISNYTRSYITAGYDDDELSSNVYISDDGGSEWRTLDGVGPVSGGVRGAAGVVVNGTIVALSGLRGDGVLMNAVWSSRDAGTSWIVSTDAAAWSARWNAAVVVIPDTRIVLLAGGCSAYTAPSNNTYISTDGIGAVWTLQSDGPFVDNICSPTLVALNDATANANATVLFFGGYVLADKTIPHFQVYRSNDLGVSYSRLAAPQIWDSTPIIAAVADFTTNFVYAINSQRGTLFVSTDSGESWSVLLSSAVTNPLPNCMTVRYSAGQFASSVSESQVVIYAVTADPLNSNHTKLPLVTTQALITYTNALNDYILIFSFVGVVVVGLIAIVSFRYTRRYLYCQRSSSVVVQYDEYAEQQMMQPLGQALVTNQPPNLELYS